MTQVAEYLVENAVQFRSLIEAIDTTTPAASKRAIDLHGSGRDHSVVLLQH